VAAILNPQSPIPIPISPYPIYHIRKLSGEQNSEAFLYLFFQSVNKKYDVQKKIIMQMEEKLMMMMAQPQGIAGHNTCSPDTDRTGEWSAALTSL